MLTAQVPHSNRAPARHQIWLERRAGAIRHGGEAYARYGTPTDLAPLVGAGAESASLAGSMPRSA
jgi:hypothetical protein